MAELIKVTPGSPEWLAARREGVTATDIVTICGLSSRNSAYALYWRKLGVVAEVPDSDRFRLGRYLEGLIWEYWGEAVTDRHYPGGLYRSSERPWQMATPDRVLYTDSGHTAFSAVLECKSWADDGRHDWEDGPPAAVRAQVLWQMDVMEVARGHVAVLFLPSGEFRHYTIEHYGYEHDPDAHNQDSCTICYDIGLMRGRAEEFRLQLEGKLPPPGPDGSAASLAAVRARFPRVDKEASAKLAPEAWGIYADACERVDYWKEVRHQAENEIREMVQDAYRITVDDQVVALRIRFEAKVRAHTRQVDMIRRTPRKKEADDGRTGEES